MLVMLLSSEQVCNLAYDKAAIERFVKQFTDQQKSLPKIGSLVRYEREQVIKDMTPSTLTAHCAQVRAAAKLYGFIQ
jgi:hypothetical protein